MNELIAIEKHKILNWAPLELKNRCIRAGAKMAEQEVNRRAFEHECGKDAGRLCAIY